MLESGCPSAHLSVSFQCSHLCFFVFCCLKKRQAELYDCILKQMRPEPEYFRVGYFGMGFPSFLQVSTGVGYFGMGFPSLQVSTSVGFFGMGFLGMGFPSFLYVSGSVGYFGMGFPSFLYVSTGVGYCGMGFPSLQVSNNNNR